MVAEFDPVHIGGTKVVNASLHNFDEVARKDIRIGDTIVVERVERSVYDLDLDALLAPFIAAFAEAFPSAKILVTGVEDPDTRAHSPNESLHLGVFHRAILAEAVLLARLNERD